MKLKGKIDKNSFYAVVGVQITNQMQGHFFGIIQLYFLALRLIPIEPVIVGSMHLCTAANHFNSRSFNRACRPFVMSLFLNIRYSNL